MPKILIVEDQKDIREEIVDMLMLDKYSVIEANNGLEGIQLAQQEKPDLIISDILMPEMGGYELFQALKQTSSTSRIPFIFLSALIDYPQIRQGMNLGADDYLTKPFDYQQLTTAVKTRLQKQADEEQHRFQILAQRLIALQNRERNQMAQAIETQILESLNGLSLLASSIPEADTTTSQLLQRERNQIIQQTQNLIYQLRPILLNQLDIIQMLEWLTDYHYTQFGLRVRFHHTLVSPNLSLDLKQIIYQLVDEALANITNHANTRQAELRLRSDNVGIYLKIIDSGNGFDLEEAFQKPEAIGLLTMPERAKLVNGAVEIHTVKGKGTTISLAFPHEPQTKTAHIFSQASPAEKFQPLPPDQNRAQTIVLADDHEVVCQGLQRVIAKLPMFNVVAEAHTTERLFAIMQQQQPDIVVLDATFEQSNGLELIQLLAIRWPRTRLIIFSPYDDIVYANEVLRRGVNAYLLKSVSADEIVDALKAVAQNEQYVCVDIANNLQEWRLTRKYEDRAMLDVLNPLTVREREIFYLVIQGQSSSQIAQILNISSRTVETHRHNLMRKLQLKGTNELLKFAVRHDLIEQANI